MGKKHSVFTKQELDDYEALTYLNKTEIEQVYERFAALNPTAIMLDRNANLPFKIVADLPELRANPFRQQMMKVFSSSGDGMTFEDFLDLMSVFSDKAPKAVKVEYAFRIYDFDGDDLIGNLDLKEIIGCLTGREYKLSEEEVQQLIDNILDETDLDGDDAISFAEFEHAISKALDFCSSFVIRL